MLLSSIMAETMISNPVTLPCTRPKPNTGNMTAISSVLIMR